MFQNFEAVYKLNPILVKKQKSVFICDKHSSWGPL